MANKQIILMRHAKSDWSSGAQSDHDRPLNSRGRNNALRVGQWFVENDYQPEVILCSDASRTQETLELVAESSGWVEFGLKVKILASLYLASKNSIISTINETLVSTDRVMLVGHNPGMDLAFLQLYPLARTLVTDKLMTTASVAILEKDTLDTEDWDLVSFKTPKDLN
jgi:phosphohistidine phosphatase